MANEIRVYSHLQVDNGNFREEFAPAERFVTQNGVGATGHTQVISTGSETVIDLSGVTTLGYFRIANVGTNVSNYVVWGPDSGGAMVPVGRLDYGDCAVFRLEPGITLRAQAHGGDVPIGPRAFED